jgi:hypothetical protein
MVLTVTSCSIKVLMEPKVIMTERNTIRVKRDLEDYKVFVS